MPPRDWESTVPPAVHKPPLKGDPRANGGGIRNLDRYVVRKVNWLDKPFWQQACFELVAGKEGGVCKGTYLAGLWARCSVGKLYDVPKRCSLVVTSEDSIELDCTSSQVPGCRRRAVAGGDCRQGLPRRSRATTTGSSRPRGT